MRLLSRFPLAPEIGINLHIVMNVSLNRYVKDFVTRRESLNENNVYGKRIEH